MESSTGTNSSRQTSHGSQHIERLVHTARLVLDRLPGARSPLVLFDEDALTTQVERWREHLGAVTPHFAIKSCDALPVLDHLHRLGVSFDAATAGEIQLLEQLGVDPAKVICTHPVRDHHDIAAIARFRPRALVVDNVDELRKLARAGIPGTDYSPDLFLRIELPFGGLSNKFGVEVTSATATDGGSLHWQLADAPARRIFDEARRIERQLGVRYARFGLSSHVGTNTYEVDKYKVMLRTFSHLRQRLATHGIEIAVFNLGGGYCDHETPVAHDTTQEAFLATLGAHVRDLHHALPAVDLIAEPGRYMVANSGSVVIGVMRAETRHLLSRDDGSFERLQHLKVQINDGLYGNLLGERHDAKTWHFEAFRLDPDAPFSAARLPAVLNGKTCDSWDRVARMRPLPADLRAGDLLLVPNAGAYTIVTATDFNLAPRAQLCMVRTIDDGRVECRLYDPQGQPEASDPGIPSAGSVPAPATCAPASQLSGWSQVPTLSRIVGSLVGEVASDLLRPGVLVGDPGWQHVRALVACNDATLEADDVAPIAEGGMGWVLRITEQRLERPVALKIGKVPATGALGERFHNEAKKTAALKDDPRIPVVYRFGFLPEGGHPYYTMELVEGRTLASLIDELHVEPANGPVDWRNGARRAILEHLRHAAEALDYAHQRGVLHRDVKPANLMVPDDPRLPVKVLDWGLLRAGLGAEPQGAGQPPAESGATRTGTVLGTIDYMSPEQARGQAVAAATDIWSLGATLYHAVCGRPPLAHHGSEEQRLAALRAADDELVRPPSATTPDVPPELEALIMRALRCVPTARYASAGALAGDLARFLDRRPVDAFVEGRGRGGSLSYRITKTIERRPRTAWGVAAGASVLLAITTVTAFRFAEKSRMAESERAIAAASLESFEELFHEVVAALKGSAIKPLLDRQVRYVEASQAPLPVRMRQQSLVGGAYLDLQFHDEAGELLREAFEWAESSLPSGSTQRATHLEQYADYLAMGGEPQRANELMRASLAIFETGGDDRAIIRTQSKLAAQVRPDDPDQALALLRHAVARAHDALGVHDPLTLAVESDLGLALALHGELGEGDATLAAVVEHLAELPSAPERVRREIHVEWATLLQVRGEYERSATVLQNELERARREFGTRSPAAGHIMSELAMVFERLGRTADALVMQEELVRYAAEVYPNPLHANRVATRNNLGLMLSSIGRLDEAEEHLAAVHAARVAVHGAESALTAQALLNWGTNDSRAGRATAAEAKLREALRIVTAIHGVGHRQTLTESQTLGAHLRNQGNFADAEPILLDTLAHAVRVYGEHSPQTWSPLQSVIELYRRWGRLEDAEQHALDFVQWTEQDPVARSKADTALAAIREGRE